MDEITRQKLDALLRDHGMTEDILNLPAMTHAFLSQMRIALYGGASSIPILPTFLKPFGQLTEDRPVAVAELDDREVRVSLVSFSGGKPVISERNSFPIPGREYPAPLDDLLYAAAELLEPILGQAQSVAVCLPFPVDYDSKGDGSIRRCPGTMAVTDYEKKPVRADLKTELASRGLPALPMVLVRQPDAVLAAAGAEQSS